jgi:hypothetical protein
MKRSSILGLVEAAKEVLVEWLFPEPEERKDVENSDCDNNQDNKEPASG